MRLVKKPSLISQHTLRILKKNNCDTSSAVIIHEGNWGSRDSVQRRNRRLEYGNHKRGIVKKKSSNQKVKKKSSNQKEQPATVVKRSTPYEQREEKQPSKDGKTSTKTSLEKVLEHQKKKRIMLQLRHMEHQRRLEKTRLKARRKISKQFPSHWRHKPKRNINAPIHIESTKHVSGGHPPFDFSVGTMHSNYIKYISKAVENEEKALGTYTGNDDLIQRHESGWAPRVLHKINPSFEKDRINGTLVLKNPQKVVQDINAARLEKNVNLSSKKVLLKTRHKLASELKETSNTLRKQIRRKHKRDRKSVLKSALSMFHDDIDLSLYKHQRKKKVSILDSKVSKQGKTKKKVQCSKKGKKKVHVGKFSIYKGKPSPVKHSMNSSSMKSILRSSGDVFRYPKLMKSTAQIMNSTIKEKNKMNIPERVARAITSERDLQCKVKEHLRRVHVRE